MEQTDLIVDEIVVILNEDQGSRCLKLAKSLGAKGGTVERGWGTTKSNILSMLGLNRNRKEVVHILVRREVADRVMETIRKKFHLELPNHGIMYAVNVCHVAGSKNVACQQGDKERSLDTMGYQIITTIVERGRAEEVVEAAEAAGSRGGTVMNARGSGVHEREKLFNMDIEPQKEVVIILSPVEDTKAIVDAIHSALHLDEPGNGIIYVQDTVAAYGLR